MASLSWRRSASTVLGMSGYCSLQATSRAVGQRARDAPARGSRRPRRPGRNCGNCDCQSGPSSPAMRRRTKAQPIGGALACSCESSAAYSAGSASGMVERNCATFISGPFRPPRMARRSSACAARSVLMPKTRSPATRAAMPPTAPEVRAKRRTLAEETTLVAISHSRWQRRHPPPARR